MTDLALYRLYEPHDVGKDGYPSVWHKGLFLYGNSSDELRYMRLPMPGAGPQISEHGWFQHGGVKHLVRAEAGHRCVRCRHPYRNGEHGNGQWSVCDERCTHGGPLRVTFPDGFDAEVVGALTIEDGVTVAELFDRAKMPGMRVEAAWRILTVHHLDGDKRNCRWWNLAALCQRCHLRIQGRVRMERVWPWEHSEWFKPYVAGYYAWAYLGEEISRDEAEARMDELLGLELMVNREDGTMGDMETQKGTSEKKEMQGSDEPAGTTDAAKEQEQANKEEATDGEA